MTRTLRGTVRLPAHGAAAEQLRVAIGDPGLIDVIDGRSLAVVEQVTTEAGAHTTVFDPQRQRLYVFLPGSCKAAVYAVTTNSTA